MLRLAERKHTPPALARTRRARQCPRPRRRRPQTTTRTGHPATLDRRPHHRRPRRSRSPATIRRSARPVPPAHHRPLPATGRHDRCRPHRRRRMATSSPNPDRLPVPASRSLWRARQALAGSPSKNLAGEPSKSAVTLTRSVKHHNAGRQLMTGFPKKTV